MKCVDGVIRENISFIPSFQNSLPTYRVQFEPAQHYNQMDWRTRNAKGKTWVFGAFLFVCGVFLRSFFVGFLIIIFITFFFTYAVAPL